MSKKLLSVILAGVMLLAMPGMAVLADTEAGELYDPEHGVRISTTDPRVTEEAYLDVSVTEEGEELEACAKDLDKDLGIYLYTIQVKTRNQEEPLDLAGAEYAKCRISFPFGTMPGRTCRVYRVTKAGTLEPLKSAVDTYMIDGHTFLFDYTGDKFVVTGVKKCGDMNGDGLIGTEDALTVLKMIVKLVPRSEAKELIGDVNGDGVLDVTDAEHILFRIVGIIDHFKVETGW